MALDDEASSRGLVSIGAVPEQDADSTAELARLYASWRRQRVAIEDLTGELRVSRRGAKALAVENAVLRAELATFGKAEVRARPRSTAGSVTALPAATRDVAARNGGPDGEPLGAHDGDIGPGAPDASGSRVAQVT